MCFIDYKKAFDYVDHERLWMILRDMGVPVHLIVLLRRLYTNHEATVRMEFGETDNIDIAKGVRQGCILSPLLFNIYAENVMREALEEWERGISIGGRMVTNLRYADDTTLLAGTKGCILSPLLFNIYAENVMREALEEWERGISIGGRMVTNLRYADDTTLLAGTKEDLIELVGRVRRASERAGLYLNVGKTKMMTTGDIGAVTVDGKDIEVHVVTPQIASHVGPTSAEDRHWLAISADMADIRPTSAAYRDKSAIFADMADIWPTSAAYRDKSAIFADMADIWPTSSPRANMESARYLPTCADIGPI